MPDSPDWSKYLPQSNRYSLQDLGELAARIGSPVTYDRRGEVIWYDRMQDAGVAWRHSPEGTGSAIEVVGVDTYWPGFALQLTAGSDGTRQAFVNRYFSPSRPSKWGLEVGFWIKQSYDYFQIDIIRSDGSVLYFATAKYTFTTKLLEVQTPGGVWVTVGSIGSINSTNPVYHNLKVVGDFDSNEYVRVLLDTEEFDVSGNGLNTQSIPIAGFVALQIILKGRAGFNDKAQIGNVIFTSNEP